MENNTIIGIINARMGSSRLPGKMLLKLQDKTVFEHLVCRIQDATLFDLVVLATSRAPENKVLMDLAHECGIEAYAGSEEDVLDRYVQILRLYDAQNCVRFCGDNPLTDMETAAVLVHHHLNNNLDYTCIKGFQLQLGLVEVFSRHALETAWTQTDLGDEMRRESLGIFIRENLERFRTGYIEPDAFLHRSPYRLTLDYPEDYKMLNEVFAGLYQGRPIPYRQALEFLMMHPEIAKLNQGHAQKQGSQYWLQLDQNLERYSCVCV